MKGFGLDTVKYEIGFWVMESCLALGAASAVKLSHQPFYPGIDFELCFSNFPSGRFISDLFWQINKTRQGRRSYFLCISALGDI